MVLGQFTLKSTVVYYTIQPHGFMVRDNDQSPNRMCINHVGCPLLVCMESVPTVIQGDIFECHSTSLGSLPSSPQLYTILYNHKGSWLEILINIISVHSIYQSAFDLVAYGIQGFIWGCINNDFMK